MRLLSFPFLFFAIALGAGAAPQPASERTPFTARELAQGYREQTILARPLATHRAIADAAEAREGVRVRQRFARFRDLRVIELDGTEELEVAIARLRATGRYEFVEPDHLQHLALEPNDPEFLNGAQWALRNTGQFSGIPRADIQAPAAWDLAREAPNVIVAVIDTGVNIAHQDLAGNIWQNPNPTFGDVNGARFLNGIPSGNPADDNGHGTHIAGTIGALGNNNLAVAGIAWRVQIMPIKAFPSSGTGATSDIIAGIDYALANGAHIINASYGGTSNTGYVEAHVAAIRAARDAGVIFVAAAGNDAANMDVARYYPASHLVDNIVTVGNSTRRDELALSTNYGSIVDLHAPGSEIVSLAHNDNTGTTTLSGTSMAAPHVSGALALLKTRFPADSYRQLINRLLRGVERGERFTGRSQTGGRLNLFNALTSTSNRPFNDDFAQRPRLAGNNAQVRASTVDATAEPGESAHAGITSTKTLWWEWTPEVSGTVTLDTADSNHDTVAAVYTAGGEASPTSLAGLTLLAANDNDPTAQVISSRLTFNAVAGVLYQIAVGGKFDGGMAVLNLSTTPANDLFAGAETLAGRSLRVTTANTNCSREPGEPRVLGWPGGNSLWYRWTAPHSGRFQIAAVSDDFDPVLAVFTGTTLNALTYVAENDNAAQSSIHTGSLCTIEVTAGTTYSIVVDSKGPALSGQFTLTIVDSLWQGATGGNVTGSAALGTDGTVYFGSTDRSVYAFSPEGHQKWSAPTNGIIDTCSPAIGSDGTVYIGSNDGRLYAFNADGTTKWTRNFGATAPVSNSPALAADGTVYIKAGDGFLYALDSASGADLWRHDIRAPQTYASPAVGPDGTVYQGSDDNLLYAFHPDGTLKWTFATDNEIFSVPALDGAGNLYFGVLGSGKFYSLTSAGTLRWIYSGAALGSSSSPALSADGGTAYFAGYDSQLHAVDTATGAARWTYPLGDEVRGSSPAVDANGVIYIGSYDFRLYAINADGTLKRTYDTAGWIRSSPAIFGTTLYLGSNDAKLYAFDLGVGAASGPWPQYRQNVRRTGRDQNLAPFAITAAPSNRNLRLGDALILGVTATGEGPLTYEWHKDGVLLAGATGPSYEVAVVTADVAGSYTVTVRGLQGSLTTLPAIVSVTPHPHGQLKNLSVRAVAGTGSQKLAVGFVLQGESPKPLLLRGIGPSLAQFGVASPLEDPRLQLHSVAGIIDSNEVWGGSSAIATAAASAGAFPLESTSTDAALLRPVEAGNYTVSISGVGDTTGVALAEVYDTESGPAGPTGSRLINLSARAQVAGGADILIAGFSISGSQPKAVLVRAIGPSLAPFGVDGALADPRLEVYHGDTKIKISENDDWGGSTALAGAFAQAGAFALDDPASRDAALLLSLDPGSYTVHVSGVNNATGVALVEVYEVP